MSGSSSPATGQFSCPRKGAFYVCADSAVRFVGCCRTDPCANGGVCADGDLGTTTFSADSYDEIPPQNCSGGGGGAAWYTCKFTSPPFLGCCVSNPCASDPGGCPGRDLRAARLSDNDSLAGPFLGSSSTSSKSSSSRSSSSTARITTTTSALAPTRSAASPTASTTAPGFSPRPAEEASNNSLPVGAVAGVAVGGFALCVVIGFLAWRLRRQRRRARAAEIQADQMTIARGPGNPPPRSPPYSPYKGSFTSSPTVVGSSPVSPPTAAWSSQSPRPSDGWASPGPERAASARPMSELAGSEIGYHDRSGRGARAR